MPACPVADANVRMRTPISGTRAPKSAENRHSIALARAMLILVMKQFGSCGRKMMTNLQVILGGAAWMIVATALALGALEPVALNPAVAPPAVHAVLA
jgi:hypothetical protein